MNKALFLDRDGVINYDRQGYIHKIKDYEFIPKIFETIKKFQNQNYLIIIITNQSGIGRKYYTEQQYQLLKKHIEKEFEKQQIKITKTYHCPHTPQDNCECRKPKNQMLIKAQKEYNIDFKQSLLIGDKNSDTECGNSLKIKSFKIQTDTIGELEKIYKQING